VGWVIQSVALSGLTFPVARLRFRLYLGAALPDPQGTPQEAWLDTGAPLSVIPLHIHNKGLPWQPIPGIKTTWSGQPCDLGRIDMWLPTDQAPYLCGPFSLLAKFPQSDPPGDPVPLLLGLEFLLTYQTEFHLLCPPQQGTLVLT
jgi:hypothetical protein